MQRPRTPGANLRISNLKDWLAIHRQKDLERFGSAPRAGKRDLAEWKAARTLSPASLRFHLVKLMRL
ncbi:hypothetical protein ASD52_23055 [Ensifer sp. Root142]|nr:hypothetical protein ASD00_32915 [Ensifer sp. Root31]KQW55709.1 hypothetical protein ASD03_19355 [Ensifer sp. Root127]KQY76886.1 hypothetical protein ASD52_23055 [Ensifer sp. Root142]KRC57125.1 hypothetical protein ASE32_19645 [Ensifer sp. Root231]KRC87620.1 hypothetical protein ASE47_13800 [Ensifer sp. Root258]PSS64247.1 hypothetical protein C6558_11885 [Ensifer sp. NM-2]